MTANRAHRPRENGLNKLLYFHNVSYTELEFEATSVCQSIALGAVAEEIVGRRAAEGIPSRGCKNECRADDQ